MSDSDAESERASPRCSITVTDDFQIELENLVDMYGQPCEFNITIEVESPGHGDQIAMDIEQEIRLAAYDAMDKFDERLDDD